MSQPTIPWEDRNFEYYWRSVLVKLETVYRRTYPGETSFSGVYAKIFHQNPEPDAYARNCFASNPVGTVDLMLVSAIYSARAAKEHLNNQKQMAWTYLMDAQYHAGAAWYSMVLNTAMPEIEEQTALEAIKDIQRAGGKVTNALWLDIEHYAVELITARAKQGNTWTTERKMAAAIKEDVMEYAKKNGTTISEKRFVQTISDRLKQRQHEIGPYLTRKKHKP